MVTNFSASRKTTPDPEMEGRFSTAKCLPRDQEATIRDGQGLVRVVPEKPRDHPARAKSTGRICYVKFLAPGPISRGVLPEPPHDPGREAREVMNMAHCLAALVLLEPALNDNYLIAKGPMYDRG